MGFLDDRTRAEVAKILEEMKAPVRLITFGQSFECDSCVHSRTLIDELTAVSEKLEHEVFDFVADNEKVKELNVDKVPATVVSGPGGNRIRFYGVPAGYEFATLLQDLVMNSKSDSALSPESREKLRKINKPVHLQVLVTPT